MDRIEHEKLSTEVAKEEGQWSGPLRKAPPIYVGETYLPSDIERHPNGAPLGIRCKPSRRMLRGLLKKNRSSIECSIKHARTLRLESERYATNSHEAKRYVEMERNERIATKEWWHTWRSMWAAISISYKSLTDFARAK